MNEPYAQLESDTVETDNRDIYETWLWIGKEGFKVVVDPWQLLHNLIENSSLREAQIEQCLVQLTELRHKVEDLTGVDHT